MRNTFIMNFPKQKNNKGYSFKESDYKDLTIFLKRLEDDRIFFDNQIYDKDFFDYEKLEELIKIFYNIRDAYIKTSFEKMKFAYEKVLKSKNSFAKRNVPIMRVLSFEPGVKDEWLNLTYDQYELLDKAYRFDFEIYEYKSIKDMFPAHLYKFGWECIKPTFCAYKDALFRHYDDDGVYRRIFDPFDSGTFSEKEWFEYDEKKKYNEFDIYSKTNTYAKYNLYNDSYYKDYKGEKFSTKSNFDFTEEEIKANFDNMVNNKTLVKYNHIIENEKNKRYLNDFADALIKYEQRAKAKKGLQRYTFFAYEDVKKYRYAMLNDPRNILILPLVDSFIELYRAEGYYDGDNSFTDFPFSNKKDVQMVFFYELSIEYQESCAIQGWFYEDYTDIVIDEEFDEKEDLFFILLAGLSTFYCCLFVLLYYLGYSTIVYDVKNQLMMGYEALNNLHSYYISNKPHLYYDLINRKGRCITRGKQLPPHFYYDCNLIFNRRRGRGFLPFGILDRISRAIDNHDFLVRKMAYYLWNFGTFLGFR